MPLLGFQYSEGNPQVRDAPRACFNAEPIGAVYLIDSYILKHFYQNNLLF